MKRFTKWFGKLGLVEKLLVVIIPVSLIIIVIATRIIFWGVLNKGKETPLPAIAHSNEVNLDTLKVKGYHADRYKVNYKEKDDAPLELLRSDLVPFSPIAREKNTIRVIDDHERVDEVPVEQIPNDFGDAYAHIVPSKEVGKTKVLEYDPMNPAPPTKEDYYVPRPVLEINENNHPVSSNQPVDQNPKAGFNIMRTNTDDLQRGLSNLNIGEKPVKAAINGNQTITNDSRISIRTTEDGSLGGLQIPKGTVIHAKAFITDKRINAYVERITIGGKVYPIALTLCDMDLQEGLTYNQDKIVKRNTAKETASNVLDRAIGTVTGGLINTRDATRAIEGVDKDSQVQLHGGREIYIISI